MVETPVDDVPSFQLDHRVSKRGYIGCLAFVLLAIGGMATFVYFAFHPRDRVQCTVKNMPVGTRWFCLASENDGQIELMDWSPYHIFPGRMTPQSCTLSYPAEEARLVRRDVMWQFGNRYGVVTRGTDKKWRITWLNAADVPIHGRVFLFGEGEVEMDLAKGQTELMNTDDIRRFGFQDFRWNDEK